MKNYIFIIASIFIFVSCSKQKAPINNSSNESEVIKKADPTQPPLDIVDVPAEEPANLNNSPHVIIVTSYGDITIELDALNAPVTVKNFLTYVESKHYDNTIFHRVIEGFMIQGGGFSSEGDEKVTNPPIKNEGKNGLSNKKGTIAMARTQVPDSATSQFFINTVDNSRGLDAGGANGPDGYAVFGKVISGMDIVDKIQKVRVGPKTLRSLSSEGKLYARPNGDVPTENVLIKSISIKNE